MSTTSLYLQMALQALDENPDTWGEVLNVSAVQLLEDGIAGTGNVDVTTGDQTLTDAIGGPSDLGPAPAPAARFMILNITGTPGVDREVIVPARSKVYLAVNNTTGGDVVTVKTSAGTGITIPAAEGQWVFCDGTNVLAASAATATLAETATSAVDSAALIGVAGAGFAQKDLAQTFTKGQMTLRESLLVAGAGPWTLDVDCAVSNAFYHLTTQNFTLTAPTNATIGQTFSLIIEQGVGAPHTIAYASATFQAAAGAAPLLSTTLANVDYLSFEYYASAAGNRWVMSIIKNVSDV